MKPAVVTEVGDSVSTELHQVGLRATVNVIINEAPRSIDLQPIQVLDWKMATASRDPTAKVRYACVRLYSTRNSNQIGQPSALRSIIAGSTAGAVEIGKLPA